MTGDGNKAAVSEELQQLKALSLSFVKDLKFGISCQSPQTSSGMDLTISSSGTETELNSKCDTIGEIEDLDDTDGGDDLSLMHKSETTGLRPPRSSHQVSLSLPSDAAKKNKIKK